MPTFSLRIQSRTIRCLHSQFSVDGSSSVSSILIFVFIFLDVSKYVCVWVCLYMHTAHECGCSWKSGLELQLIVSCLICVLGIKLESFSKATCALNSWVIFLGLCLWKNVSHLFCQCLPILVCLIVPLDETEILYDSSIPHDRWSVRPHMEKWLCCKGAEQFPLPSDVTR